MVKSLAIFLSTKPWQEANMETLKNFINFITFIKFIKTLKNLFE